MRIRTYIMKALRWECAAALFALVVVVYLLMSGPVVGMADNGDFARIMGTVGLAPLNPHEPPQEMYYGYFHKVYAFKGMGLGGYASTEIPVVLLAVWLGKLLPGPGFDIRVLGALYAIVLIYAIYTVVKLNKLRSSWINGFLALTLVVVFADIGYVAYFNSLFGEPVSYVFLLLAVALGMRLGRTQRPSRWLAAAFFAAVAMFVGSKTQNAPVGFVFALVGLRLWKLRPDLRWKRAIASGMAALMMFSAAVYVAAPKELRQINQYQTVFFGILKDSPTPEQDLRELGLDPKLAVNANTNYFTPDAPIKQRDPLLEREFYSRIDHEKVLLFYIKHPLRFVEKLKVAARNGLMIRPYYLGNYEKSTGKNPGAMSNAFGIWSEWKKSSLPGGLWFVVLIYVVYGAGLAVCYRRSRSAADRLYPDLFAAVAATGLISFVVPIIGDGEADIGKHLFLYNVCFDIMLVSGVVWAINTIYAKMAGRFGK